MPRAWELMSAVQEGAHDVSKFIVCVSGRLTMFLNRERKQKDKVWGMKKNDVSFIR